MAVVQPGLGLAIEHEPPCYMPATVGVNLRGVPGVKGVVKQIG
jgi:hypothetical protein